MRLAHTWMLGQYGYYRVGPVGVVAGADEHGIRFDDGTAVWELDQIEEREGEIYVSP